MKIFGIAIMIFGLGSILFGGNGGSFFGVLLFVVGFFVLKNAVTQNFKPKNEKKISELPEILEADYKHIYKASAIALNKNKKTLFLAVGDVKKSYSFVDVRKWSYEILTGGQIIGGSLNVANGLHSAIVNTRTRKENIEKSGLFIEVRDIEYPKWQIRFEDDKNMESQLLRWMEILRQNINES